MTHLSNSDEEDASNSFSNYVNIYFLYRKALEFVKRILLSTKYIYSICEVTFNASIETSELCAVTGAEGSIHYSALI